MVLDVVDVSELVCDGELFCGGVVVHSRVHARVVLELGPMVVGAHTATLVVLARHDSRRHFAAHTHSVKQIDNVGVLAA